MSGTGNQIILQILRQLHEIRTVACNPHNQVAVLLRLLLGRQQRLTIYRQYIFLLIIYCLLLALYGLDILDILDIIFV